MQKNSQSDTARLTLPKSTTGIQGLDVITNGGLPKNRPTLLLGNTGCGKTIMAMQFLVNGVLIYDEPGVFISFEEKTDELITNVSSLGYDLNEQIANNKIYLEHMKISPDGIHQTGRYDIEGLFVRLEQAINKVNAKRVVLDSLDTLFYGFDPKVLRLEFKRLLSWLKEKNVTAIITGEIGNNFLTRHGVEEYVADCVIVLDNRSVNQVTTRRLRIAKYRGSVHGNNEYPFIIDENGITVLPLISVSLKQESSSKRISSGIDQLDAMLDKKGFFVGSSILISGTAGTGKTSIAAAFAYDVCNEKQSCLFCAFEETPNQIIRNMKSIGLDLSPMIKSDLLHFYYARPSLQNLELHFIAIKKMIKETKPSAIILDPVTNLMTEGTNSDTRSMLITFIDFLKSEQISIMFTAAITVGSILRNPSDEGISSMVDTWMLVEDIEKDANRTQTFCIKKSRGMIHSKEVKKFIISSNGIELQPILKKEN